MCGFFVRGRIGGMRHTSEALFLWGVATVALGIALPWVGVSSDVAFWVMLGMAATPFGILIALLPIALVMEWQIRRKRAQQRQKNNSPSAHEPNCE